MNALLCCIKSLYNLLKSVALLISFIVTQQHADVLHIFLLSTCRWWLTDMICTCIACWRILSILYDKGSNRNSWKKQQKRKRTEVLRHLWERALCFCCLTVKRCPVSKHTQTHKHRKTKTSDFLLYVTATGRGTDRDDNKKISSLISEACVCLFCMCVWMHGERRGFVAHCSALYQQCASVNTCSPYGFLSCLFS